MMKMKSEKMGRRRRKREGKGEEWWCKVLIRDRLLNQFLQSGNMRDHFRKSQAVIQLGNL